MADRICSVHGCDRSARTRGWCSAHYMRWTRYGDPRVGGPVKRLKPHRTCALDGCDSEPVGHGLCDKHYTRQQRWGDPNGSAPIVPDEERFWERVDKTAECWLWIGHKNVYGYGRFGHSRTEVFAHRYAYELANGDIPAGLVIDHLCHNTLCVRPDHLAAVTPKQNIEQRIGPNANSTTGILGVYRARNGKWVARVGHLGRYHHVGTYLTAEDAEAAVIAKRIELFTHNLKDRKGA